MRGDAVDNVLTFMTAEVYEMLLVKKLKVLRNDPNRAILSTFLVAGKVSVVMIKNPGII
ncbi:hypothetical protein [Schleiferilactobacillus perolens]|uniref:Uncharacterized protein n=1 Tax=Schleiferilactobacillus perolens DSM 12744 TaxID=1423792 RepID=A0A0R1N8D4_9LACO|nr:hypothetical protein [Schleiferilactobacillus perolens]KRL12584.1 hypothetical protein FD09_GL002903 [Schleiferilactobacillus perolens DSM 12744]